MFTLIAYTEKQFDLNVIVKIIIKKSLLNVSIIIIQIFIIEPEFTWQPHESDTRTPFGERSSK